MERDKDAHAVPEAGGKVQGLGICISGSTSGSLDRIVDPAVYRQGIQSWVCDCAGDKYLDGFRGGRRR